MSDTAKTKHFKSAAGYKRAQAFIHMHIHKGPSKHPYNVEIRGKRHHVQHGKRKDPKRRKRRHHSGGLTW